MLGSRDLARAGCSSAARRRRPRRRRRLRRPRPVHARAGGRGRIAGRALRRARVPGRDRRRGAGGRARGGRPLLDAAQLCSLADCLAESARSRASAQRCAAVALDALPTPLGDAVGAARPAPARRARGRRDVGRRRLRRRARASARPGRRRVRHHAAALDRPGRSRHRARLLRAGGVRRRARLCHALGLPHVSLDLRDAFRATSSAVHRRLRRRARRPNPCTALQRRLPPARARRRRRRGSAPRALATGHYARIVERDGGRSSPAAPTREGPVLHARPRAARRARAARVPARRRARRHEVRERGRGAGLAAAPRRRARRSASSAAATTARSSTARRRPAPRARSRTRPGELGRHAGAGRSRRASAAASASRRPSRSTCARSSRPRASSASRPLVGACAARGRADRRDAAPPGRPRARARCASTGRCRRRRRAVRGRTAAPASTSPCSRLRRGRLPCCMTRRASWSAPGRSPALGRRWRDEHQEFEHADLMARRAPPRRSTSSSCAPGRSSSALYELPPEATMSRSRAHEARSTYVLSGRGDSSSTPTSARSGPAPCCSSPRLVTGSTRSEDLDLRGVRTSATERPSVTGATSCARRASLFLRAHGGLALLRAVRAAPSASIGSLRGRRPAVDAGAAAP